MARPRRTSSARARDEARHRGRILGALATCISDKGFAGTTISDVAATAGVSKSTVYEHFSDKHEAFLSLYSRATDNVLKGVRDSVDEMPGFERLPWRDQLRLTTFEYLKAMARGQGLTRCLLIEVQAVSREALHLRREVLGRYVRFFRDAVEKVSESEAVRVPSDRILLGVVGGMNEHMLAALEAEGPDALPSVAGACADLLILAAAAPAHLLERSASAPEAGLA